MLAEGNISPGGLSAGIYMPCCLRASVVASVLTTHNHVLSCHGLQPTTPLISQWRVIRFSSSMQHGSREDQTLLHDPLHALCRQPKCRFYFGRPSQHRKLCQRVTASIALQGAPGILIGLGAFLAGVALAAFLLAAIPTLVVSTLDLSCSLPVILGSHRLI